MELDLEEVDIGELLEEIAENARPAAAANGNEFSCVDLASPRA